MTSLPTLPLPRTPAHFASMPHTSPHPGKPSPKPGGAQSAPSSMSSMLHCSPTPSFTALQRHLLQLCLLAGRGLFKGGVGASSTSCSQDKETHMPRKPSVTLWTWVGEAFACLAGKAAERDGRKHGGHQQLFPFLFVPPNSSPPSSVLPHPRIASLDEIFLVSSNPGWFRKSHFPRQHGRPKGDVAATGGCFCPARTLGQEEGTGWGWAMHRQCGVCLALRVRPQKPGWRGNGNAVQPPEETRWFWATPRTQIRTV